jgi:hypothetical protein
MFHPQLLMKIERCDFNCTRTMKHLVAARPSHSGWATQTRDVASTMHVSLGSWLTETTIVTLLPLRCFKRSSSRITSFS